MAPSAKAAAERESSASSPRPRRTARSSACPLRVKFTPDRLHCQYYDGAVATGAWPYHPGGFVQSRSAGTARAPVRAIRALAWLGPLRYPGAMDMRGAALDEIAEEVRACRLCRDAPRYGGPLPHEPRPVFQVS